MLHLILSSLICSILSWLGSLKSLVVATFLAATLFAFNFLGDGLRDALDPRDR